MNTNPKFSKSLDSEVLANAKLQKSLIGTLFRHATEWRIDAKEWVSLENRDEDTDETCYPTLLVTRMVNGEPRGQQEHLFLSTLVREIIDFDGLTVDPEDAVGAFTIRCREIYDLADSDDDALDRIVTEFSGKTVVCDRTKRYNARTWKRKLECWSDKPTPRTAPQFKVKA